MCLQIVKRFLIKVIYRFTSNSGDRCLTIYPFIVRETSLCITIYRYDRHNQMLIYRFNDTNYIDLLVYI